MPPFPRVQSPLRETLSGVFSSEMPTPFRTVRIPCIESFPLRPRGLVARVHTATELTDLSEATPADR